MMLSQQCSTSGLRRSGHSIISNSNRGLQTAMLRPVEYIPETHHGKTLNPVTRFGQTGDQRGSQSAAAHVVEGPVVQHEVGMTGTQQVEEVQPGLRRSRAEPGEAVVADLCTKPFLALCRVPVSSTDTQGDVSNPVRNTSRFSSRKPSCF
jgi:hypothetical protein